MQVQSLGQNNPLEEGTATHSSNLAWRIPWTAEPGRLQSIVLPRVGHDWTDLALSTHGNSMFNFFEELLNSFPKCLLHLHADQQWMRFLVLYTFAWSWFCPFSYYTHSSEYEVAYLYFNININNIKYFSCHFRYLYTFFRKILV